MSKKIILVLLAGIMVLCLVACSQTPAGPSVQASSTQEQSATPVQSVSVAPSVSVVPSASEAPNPAVYQQIYKFTTTAITAQADMSLLKHKQGTPITVAYMPAGLEATYMIAVGAGLKQACNQLGINMVELAPATDSDINGQVGMIQDAISMGVDAILLNTIDDNADMPLIQQAIKAGIFVALINTDTVTYDTPVDATIGYAQRAGNTQQGQWVVQWANGKQLNIGIIQGAPCYCATEREEGFKTGIASDSNAKVIAEIPGGWVTDQGNTAATDLLQAHPEINFIYCANDQMAYGAIKALQSLNRTDVQISANDGDTENLEEIYAGTQLSTLNTQPYVMGETAAQVVEDAMWGKFTGGYAATPAVVATKDNVLQFLQQPDTLFPKPSKTY